jgi:hypothetical protein
MEAILSGRKIYDPESGGVRERGEPKAPAKPTKGKNRDAIFDSIAASLNHANAFDLGSVELRRRFDAFDRVDDRRRADGDGRVGVAPPSTAAPAVVPGTAEFVQDLDAIAQEQRPVLPLDAYRAAYHQRGPWSDIPGWSAGCGASSVALTLAPERSTPMFDTGEHVLAAGDLYPDQLRLGDGQGVPFSYGQIVALGDFYASVEQMKQAPSAELARLKEKVVANTAWYRDPGRSQGRDISNAEWDQATGGRYLQLAESNYDHFAPPELTGMTRIGQEYDNRRRWEELHEQALVEMAQLVAASPNSSPFPEGPLSTNAFADHFLTDAFASGHLINKESVIAMFRSRFFSGGSLNSAAKDFFKKVADKAYTGEVARRFSQLEPTSPPVCAAGWCVPVHPNIRFAWMFAEVLQQAAEAEPVKIANLAVKVIHDKLNHDGVEVVNDAGDPAWTLTGDGSMNPATLAIMRKAVQQSVDNLSDPGILVSNLNPTPYHQKVWRFTPRPTPGAKAMISRVVEANTDPNSAQLVDATARLITTQLDSLIKALIDSGRMRLDS